MTTGMSDTSTRRVLWWAKTYSRPLQSEFSANETETPDELNELLEMADKRLGESNRNNE